MTTNLNDLYDQRDLDRERPRDRSHETSEFVAEAVTRWLAAHGSMVLRVHPQEMLAGKTPLGPRLRIRVQAARTPVASSIERMLVRESRKPELQGYALALALPDLPRHREAYEDLLAALPPDRPFHWLFVDRYGRVEVVLPPQAEPEAAEPESAGQSSTRSEAMP